MITPTACTTGATAGFSLRSGNAAKMVEGRIEKFYKEVCLLEQGWIKDPDKTIQQLLTERIAAIGENINIRRFVRFERGEGITKKEENFADEVMKQIGG